jgi:AraC family transcriptional regulator
MLSAGVARYQDIYPSEALLRSYDIVRPRAADLLTLEYFEAEPDRMPTQVFEQHHILLNLREEPHRVENWRNGAHRDFTFNLHEIVLTPAGIESGWHWHARSRVIVVTLEPEKLDRFVRSEMGVLLSTPQLKDVPQARDPDLVQSGAMLLDALRTRSSGSEVMYESLARIFLVKLIQRYGEERNGAAEFGRGFTASQYKRVLDYVAAHYGGDVSIEELAREAGLSPSHFSRLFKETSGDTPYQYVMDYRVEQAKKMLHDKSRPLIDVALHCGFSDQPHFNRIFKRLTGQTPREYRHALEQESSKISEAPSIL